MQQSNDRRFTLVDGMVLIAAVGLSLVLVRDYWNQRGPQIVFQTNAAPAMWSATTFWRLTTLATATFAPIAVALSLALWLLRLRQPRPAIRETFRQPGTTTCEPPRS
jgi:anti-sigma-K factor RskA